MEQNLLAKENVHANVVKNTISFNKLISPSWQTNALAIPQKMASMYDGCGSVVNPRDLTNNPLILTINIGGGIELLQFAYFLRSPKRIIGVSPCLESLNICSSNFMEAEILNDWFMSEFIDLRKGNVFNLPVQDSCIDIIANNCFATSLSTTDDIKLALNEIYRALKPDGKLILSDCVCENGIPAALKHEANTKSINYLKSISLKQYIKLLTEAGFGTIEIRSKKPYKILSQEDYNTNKLVFLESIEICAIKRDIPPDGPCVLSGKTAIYFGKKDFFENYKGIVLLRNQPIQICDKTAATLSALEEDNIFISDSTYSYDGSWWC